LRTAPESPILTEKLANTNPGGQALRGAVVLAVLVAALVQGPSPAAAAGPATSGDGAFIMPVGALHVGDQVPAFKAKDIYGADLSLQEMMRAGKKPLLAFWSMYCQACVEKFNAMVAVQAKYGPQGLQVVSVNTDGEYQKGEQEIRGFIAEYEKKHNVRINFPVLYDERNWVPAAMHIEFLPTIVSVDAKGRVFGFYQGFNEAGQGEILAGIESLVQQLLAAYPPCTPASGAAAK
jgi:peroxiredoxin